MTPPASRVGVLRKIKRPSPGSFTYEVSSCETDEFGHWLSLPRGSAWSGRHTGGVLPFDALVLLEPGSPLVAWWCGDPTNRHLKLDVGLPAVETPDGWAFTDLELDVIQRGDGPPLVEDEDEFNAACFAGHISAQEMTIARDACVKAVNLLAARRTPFDEFGWSRLDEMAVRSAD